MGFLRWMASRLFDPHPSAGRQPKLNRGVGCYEPADEFVQRLFAEIRRGGPTERIAWTELARYLAQEPFARPTDLTRPRT